jgi:hypothetical protein
LNQFAPVGGDGPGDAKAFEPQASPRSELTSREAIGRWHFISSKLPRILREMATFDEAGVSDKE